MSKSVIFTIHFAALIIGSGLGALGLFGLLILIPFALAAGFIVLGAKALGMPKQDTPGWIIFFGGPVIAAGMGWLIAAFAYYGREGISVV
ncbi:hypothetical protein [Erythrobacter sanguineus]|jgi:hypothetical protein|uniref:Uncharacterized protein n=1 Tax=Erythrobacter sanguineus TaxID=198312 RepID=A0A1M7SQK5_9SPHN|nr:hypothetical protein [Erythrobacter sanguineus]SHN60704.1 hypothetical protein SAMN02745193_02175 [Erythrobacter sanguineus]